MKRQRIIIIIKLLVLTIVFYALLALNVFHLGDILVPSSKDYLKTNISPESQDLEQNYLEETRRIQGNTGHFAAGLADDLERLCKSIEICKKMDFIGSFTDKERYTYTKIIGKVVGFISENSQEERPIQDVISSIQIKKDSGNRRGYATRDSIIFNLGSVRSNKEFIELSTHEFGHITDLGYIQGASSKKDRNYTEFSRVVFAVDDPSISYYKLSRSKEKIRKAEAKKKDFCSGYGMSDPFEDFAECFNLYTNHNSLFRQMAKSDAVLKKKYNLIAGIFDGQYVNASSQELKLVKSNGSRRPRDTTKLSN